MLFHVVQRHNRLKLLRQRELSNHLFHIRPLTRTDNGAQYFLSAESFQQICDAWPKLKLRNDHFVKDQRSLNVEPLGARETVPLSQALCHIDQRYAYKFGFCLGSELDTMTFEHPTLRLEVQRFRINE